MVSKKLLRDVFTAEQREFAALAGSLTDEQWSSPSLCEGWSVRDAVIHTAWHIHLPAVPAADLLRYKRLGETEFYSRLIARHADRSNESLIEWLASPARFSKPNLVELIIHQEDVRRPLGLTRAIPDDHLSWILSYAMTRFGSEQTGGKSRVRVEGLRIVASDLNWSAGAGREIRGPGAALLMTITGRAGAIDDFSGPGVEVLAGRGASSASTR